MSGPAVETRRRPAEPGLILILQVHYVAPEGWKGAGMHEYLDIDVSAARLEESVKMTMSWPPRAEDSAALRLGKLLPYARGRAVRWVERARQTLRSGASA